MDERFVVDGAWLTSRLGDPRVKVVQIKFEPDVDDYTDGHIPGAQSWFWKDWLWHPTDREFPTPALIAERLGKAGVSNETTLVLYSGRNQYAVYASWVLRDMLGHPDVRILNGGKKRWTLDGRPLTTDVPTVTPVTYDPVRATRDDSSRISRADLQAGLGRPGRLLIDARDPAEFSGERVKPAPGFDHGAERGGHIPGAVNLPFRDLIDQNDFTFKPEDELRRILAGAGVTRGAKDEIVTYCRLGHRASLMYFVVRYLLGFERVRVYDGSWTEWGSVVGVPVER